MIDSVKMKTINFIWLFLFVHFSLARPTYFKHYVSLNSPLSLQFFPKEKYNNFSEKDSLKDTRITDNNVFGINVSDVTRTGQQVTTLEVTQANLHEIIITSSTETVSKKETTNSMSTPEPEILTVIIEPFDDKDLTTTTTTRPDTNRTQVLFRLKKVLINWRNRVLEYLLRRQEKPKPKH